ncbi:MAG: hypothetical protein WD751_03645 [Anaerolineales bacterium]
MLNQIEDIFAILVALAVLIWGWLINESILENVPLLLGGITAILTLIVIGHWRDRRKLFAENIKLSKQILTEIDSKTIIQFESGDSILLPRDEAFEKRGKNFGATLAGASTIGLCGRTLSSTVKEHESRLTKALQSGADVRIILIDPDERTALEQLVEVSWSDAAKVEVYNHLIKYSSELLASIGKSKGISGSLKIGFLPYVPSFGLTVLNGQTNEGVIFVKLWFHGENISLGPLFDKVSSPNRFGQFAGQFEKMWDDCKEHGKISMYP